MTNLLTQTAPEVIYLQISDLDCDYDEPFPESPHCEITWCAESVLNCEVKYVRADVLIPDLKDPFTNNGDTRPDTDYRLGWNACLNEMISRLEDK